MALRLQQLALDQRDLLTGITMDPGEEAYAGGSLDSIFEQMRTPPSGRIPFALFEDDMVVGFLLAREGAALPEWVEPGRMSLHNLRIDLLARGRGFGQSALRLAGQWITRRRPAVTHVMSSVNIGNSPALRLNLACGFAPTGAMVDGRLGRQIILSVPVARLADGQAGSRSTKSL